MLQRRERGGPSSIRLFYATPRESPNFPEPPFSCVKCGFMLCESMRVCFLITEKLN